MNACEGSQPRAIDIIMYNLTRSTKVTAWSEDTMKRKTEVSLSHRTDLKLKLQYVKVF